MPEIALAIGIVLVAVTLVMLAGWAVQARLRNAGWSDVFWAFGTGVAAVVCALIPLGGFPAPPARRVLIAGLCGVWSVRLGLHIALRVRHSQEDARYREMREQHGRRFQRNLLGFMLVQGPVGALLALSVLIAAHAPRALGIFDVAAVLILAGAIAGEALADAQLNRFKADPGNRGRVCDVGLWAWSRHPNYFFEWLMWTAYPTAALGFGLTRPWVWISLAAPAVMYLLLTRVSGVPPLERAMLASRGQNYRDYQARVPAFFPFARPGA